jgi:hypothetical protein
MAYNHLSSATVTEHNSLFGKSVKDIHLCENLSVRLCIMLNLILLDFSEISTQNSTLLKFLMALGSSELELEKSSSSLNRE